MKRILIVGSMVLLGGCYLPNKEMRADYATYNQTIQHNQSQQMLLNLVRLKYRETPMFMKVGALSASYSYSIDGRANFAVGSNSKGYGVNVGSGYSTRPTITYTPLEGNTFVQQVLSEIDHEVFVLLIRSGWSMDTLCSVLVERIGNDRNDVDEPSYERFSNVVQALEEAQDAGELGVASVAGQVLLQVRTDRVTLEGEQRGDKQRILTLPMSAFQLRSFLDIMFFLGKNTQVPEDHTHMVRRNTPNGWMHIVSSKAEPEDAMVWVRHRGYYFSIDNGDLQSKDTFALMKLLYQMQAGDVESLQPVLTLPVSLP